MKKIIATILLSLSLFFILFIMWVIYLSLTNNEPKNMHEIIIICSIGAAVLGIAGYLIVVSIETPTPKGL